ncbi:MAG: hypothetical protein GY811_07625 [Myxococcales bacterium]|nr:hypothetical protein [Myxococcales bacterium]
MICIPQLQVLWAYGSWTHEPWGGRLPPRPFPKAERGDAHDEESAYFTERLEPGTSEYAEDLDANRDGTISLSELRDDTLIRNTLLNPDLDLLSDDRFRPNVDGLKESISFSVSIRAEPVDVR